MALSPEKGNYEMGPKIIKLPFLKRKFAPRWKKATAKWLLREEGCLFLRGVLHSHLKKATKKRLLEKQSCFFGNIRPACFYRAVHVAAQKGASYAVGVPGAIVFFKSGHYHCFIRLLSFRTMQEEQWVNQKPRFYHCFFSVCQALWIRIRQWKWRPFA